MSAHLRWLGAACLGIASAGVPAAADSPAFALTGHVIDAGARESPRGPCWRLHASVAEANVGHAWSATYALSSGFHATAAPAVDDIFFDSFEVCTP